MSGLILGLRPANERRRYFVTTSFIGWPHLQSALYLILFLGRLNWLLYENYQFCVSQENLGREDRLSVGNVFFARHQPDWKRIRCNWQTVDRSVNCWRIYDRGKVLHKVIVCHVSLNINRVELSVKEVVGHCSDLTITDNSTLCLRTCCFLQPSKYQGSILLFFVKWITRDRWIPPFMDQ